MKNIYKQTNQTFMIFYKKHLAPFIVFCAFIFSSVGCSKDGREQEEVVKQLVTDIYIQAATETEDLEYEGSIGNFRCLEILEVEKDSSRKEAFKATVEVQDTDLSTFFVEIKYRYVADQVLVEVLFDTAIYSK
ncbi:hypothetical protein N9B36_01705 [Akkermansiaceae bacterium]|nr:hypothetical protein [Akkermansiaceae bacterium]